MWQKEQVEQLVLHLPIREAVKDRLREELWGHLESIYEEEFLGTHNADTARLAACQRLGSKDRVGSEFAVSLSYQERIEGYLVQRIAPVGVVDIRTYACSSGSSLFVISNVIFFVFVLAASGLPGMTTTSAAIAWITGSMAAALAATSIGIVIHEVRASSTARRKGSEAGKRYRRLMLRLTSCVSISLAGTLLAWLTGYAASLVVCTYLDQLVMVQVVEAFGWEVLLPASVLMSVLSPVVAWGFVWQEHRARKLPDWPYLDPSCL